MILQSVSKITVLRKKILGIRVLLGKAILALSCRLLRTPKIAKMLLMLDSLPPMERANLSLSKLSIRVVLIACQKHWLPLLKNNMEHKIARIFKRPAKHHQ